MAPMRTPGIGLRDDILSPLAFGSQLGPVSRESQPIMPQQVFCIYLNPLVNKLKAHRPRIALSLPFWTECAVIWFSETFLIPNNIYSYSDIRIHYVNFIILKFWMTER